MTECDIPSTFADYMAEVCTDPAARNDQLVSRPPAWAEPAQLSDLGALYRRVPRGRAAPACPG